MFNLRLEFLTSNEGKLCWENVRKRKMGKVAWKIGSWGNSFFSFKVMGWIRFPPK